MVPFVPGLGAIAYECARAPEKSLPYFFQSLLHGRPGSPFLSSAACHVVPAHNPDEWVEGKVGEKPYALGAEQVARSLPRSRYETHL